LDCLEIAFSHTRSYGKVGVHNGEIEEYLYFTVCKYF
jgi:hypothetical protein